MADIQNFIDKVVNDLAERYVDTPYYWETPEEGKKLLDYVVAVDGGISKDYIRNRTGNSLYLNPRPWGGMALDFFKLRGKPYTDKYKNTL